MAGLLINPGSARIVRQGIGIRRKMKARGVRELKRYLNGDRLTQRQAIIANCASCMNYYADGKNDCLIPNCPLYPFMPYRNKEKYPDFKSTARVQSAQRNLKPKTRGRIATKGINSPNTDKTISTEASLSP
jgi:hypothetical protein